jgi:hypothetical protein
MHDDILLRIYLFKKIEIKLLNNLININKNSIKKLDDIKNYILIFLLIIIFYSIYILKK